MTSNPIVVIPSGEIISSSNDEQQLTRQESTSSLCPSGVGLEDDEASQNSSDNALRVAIQACPVLSENGCLFSKPNTAEELRQTLIQIPPSHFNKNNSLFRNALQFFRRSSVIEGESINKVIEEFSGEFVNTEFDSRTQETTISSTDSLSSSEIPNLSDDSSRSEDELLLSTIRLSDALKKGTSEAHEAAENVHFVKNFIKGDIDRDMYADLILSLYYVYETLEKELDNKAPDHFCACHFPEDLARKETLVEDVEFWHGDDYFAKPHSMSPATRDYVERLKWISRTEPLLLLSHAYTRYLGDLSGGKFLARVARRAMKLQGGDGLAFYTFENIPSEKAFKDMYREALDDLPLSTQQIEALVREANVAFLLNMRLFEELDVKSNCLSSVRPLTEVLRFKPQKTLKELMFPKEGTDASEECPFLRRKKEQSSNTVLQQQNSSSGARCPWPFVFFHDPITGLRDYQTWVLVGILLSWFWCSYIQ